MFARMNLSLESLNSIVMQFCFILLSVNIHKLSFSLYLNLQVTKLTKMFSKYLGKGHWRPLARFRNLVALDLTED